MGMLIMFLTRSRCKITKNQKEHKYLRNKKRCHMKILLWRWGPTPLCCKKNHVISAAEFMLGPASACCTTPHLNRFLCQCECVWPENLLLRCSYVKENFRKKSRPHCASAQQVQSLFLTKTSVVLYIIVLWM